MEGSLELGSGGGSLGRSFGSDDDEEEAAAVNASAVSEDDDAMIQMDNRKKEVTFCMLSRNRGDSLWGFRKLKTRGTSLAAGSFVLCGEGTRQSWNDNRRYSEKMQICRNINRDFRKKSR